MRDYGKVHTTFWTSTSVRELSEDGRTLAFYLLTCPHGTIAGVFRLPDGYICEDLQWSSERVQVGFAELFRNGFANRCGTTKWVWILKHLDWNPPENPNQRKAVAKVVTQIPEQCEWKLDFMRVCGPSLGFGGASKTNPFGTLSEPFLNQEQEQEQEQEQDREEANASVGTADPKPSLPKCDTQAVVELYHERLPEMPTVRLMPDQRKRAVAAFWRFVLTSKRSDGTPRATTAAEALAWVDDYFARVRENDFLMGRGGRAPGHESWQCDFDFLLSEKGKKHVIEKTQAVAA